MMMNRRLILGFALSIATGIVMAKHHPSEAEYQMGGGGSGQTCVNSVCTSHYNFAGNGFSVNTGQILNMNTRRVCAWYIRTQPGNRAFLSRCGNIPK